MRSIFIGDIHGCIDELQRLLEKAKVSSTDRVVALGDLVSKGPDAVAVIELLQTLGASFLRGNKEDRLLRRSHHWLGHFTTDASDRAILKRRDLLKEIASWPLYLDFPGDGILAVHGGVLPLERVDRSSLDAQSDTLATLRYLRRDGKEWHAVPKGKQRADDPFWTDVWKGDRMVIYGHTPRPEVKRTKRTIGLDTGCVYGGKLSCAIYDGGEWEIVSVAARRKYAEK